MSKTVRIGVLAAADFRFYSHVIASKSYCGRSGCGVGFSPSSSVFPCQLLYELSIPTCYHGLVRKAKFSPVPKDSRNSLLRLRVLVTNINFRNRQLVNVADITLG